MVDNINKDFSITRQEELNKDFELEQMQGFIRNLEITPGQDGKDSRYKFQIRYIDANENLVEPDDWYSGFKDAPGREGDYLIFKYKKNGIYNNVKDIIDVKLTGETPAMQDQEDIENISKEMVEPEMKSNLDGDSATLPVVIEPINREDLDKPYKALLLNGTIHLCAKRGTLSDAEIIAQYNRFLKLI